METKNETINRQTAFIVSVKDIINSKYIKTEGEWTPNYLEINSLKVSRVNVMGVIISVSDDENVKSFVLDDGSSSIQIRIFEQDFDKKLEIGDIVMIIGKPREYNDEKYIVPEIIKDFQNEDWLELRKKQLNVLNKGSSINEKNKEMIEEEIDNPPDDIFNTIKELDEGEGVYIEDLIKKHPNAEKLVENLLNEGEIFEIKPGKYKLLE
ncbi:MAG: OB-fold nucleic acid binding domain-containing protein [Candidatus Woesearchaeota archaeon]